MTKHENMTEYQLCVTTIKRYSTAKVAVFAKLYLFKFIFTLKRYSPPLLFMWKLLLMYFSGGWIRVSITNNGKHRAARTTCRLLVTGATTITSRLSVKFYPEGRQVLCDRKTLWCACGRSGLTRTWAGHTGLEGCTDGLRIYRQTVWRQMAIALMASI